MTWTPLRNLGPPTNPQYEHQKVQAGIGADETKTETVWRNDLYEVVATEHYLDPLGIVHLSIKRLDRDVIRDWRHLQQIKNEIVGEEAEAFEIFPAESRLVDTANQFHLWAIPPRDDVASEDGEAVMVIPIPRNPKTGYLVMGFHERLVSSDQQVEDYNQASAEGRHKGKQEPWEDGLTTGGDRNENPDQRLDDLVAALPPPGTVQQQTEQPDVTLDINVTAAANELFNLNQMRNRGNLSYEEMAVRILTAGLGIPNPLTGGK